MRCCQDEEQKSTEQRVFLDRELILQAAAVRVLKARKTIKHSELLTEVVDQIKSRYVARSLCLCSWEWPKGYSACVQKWAEVGCPPDAADLCRRRMGPARPVTLVLAWIADQEGFV